MRIFAVLGILLLFCLPASAANNVLVLDGDSITRGDIAGTTPYSSLFSLNGSWTVTNKGVDSETLATMVANAAANIDPLIVGGVTNVVVIWGGTNDFALGGATVATVYANLQTYCNARKAAGWNKVLVITTVSRFGNNPGTGHTNDFDIAAYNTLIRANWPTFADGLIDVAANANLGGLGAYANTTYFLADQVHPNYFSDNTIITPLANTGVNTAGGFARKFKDITIANNSFGGNIATSTTVASSATATTAGNLICVGIRWGNATSQTVTGVADTAGNTYTALTAVVNGTSDAEQIWYAKNITANAANVVTATFSATSAANAIYIWEVSGLDKTSPLVAQPSGVGVGSGTSIATGTFTTGNDNEITFAIGTAFAVGTTWTSVLNSGLDNGLFPTAGASPDYCGAQHQTTAGTQTGITVSMGVSGSPTGRIISAASFKAAQIGAKSILPGSFLPTP